jgi:hypothetical protein
VRNGVGQCRTTGCALSVRAAIEAPLRSYATGMEYFLPHLKVFNSPLLPDSNICSNLRQSFET